MSVHFIKKQTIEDYVKGDARSKSSFDIGINNIDHADWNRSEDIKPTFNSAVFAYRYSNLWDLIQSAD